MFTPVPIEVIEAFGLMLARTGALFLVAPILGIGTGLSGYKVALITITSFILYVALGEPLAARPDGVTYGVMMVREVLIGVFLGLTLEVVLLAVRVGGEMIGHEMGFLMARQTDPVTGIQSTLVTNLYENVFLLTLLLANGHHWLFRSLRSSFEVAPIGRISMGAGIAPTFQAMFAEMFGAGIVFAAPVLVFLMMVSVLIGLLARAVPTLNVMEIGFTLRVGVALLVMYMFAPLLEPALVRLHESFLVWTNRSLEAIAG